MGLATTGCAYPEIVESIRAGPLPSVERVESQDVSKTLQKSYPLGSKTRVAVKQLRDAGFDLRTTFPQPYLQINCLDVTWRGGRAFRKKGQEFGIAIQLDSRNGLVVDLRATVKKYFF